MDGLSTLDALERSERFVAVSKALCAKLHRTIETRQRDGLNTDADVEILALVEAALARRIDERIELLKELARET